MILTSTFILSILFATIFEKQLASFIRICRKLVGKEFIKDFSFDENGIDQLDVGTINGKFYGKQYHPVFLAHKALEMLDNSSFDQAGFLQISDWLSTNIKPENNNFLLYNYPNPHYQMDAPWFSAMAQGRALEVMVHAFQLTEDKKYHLAAEKILASLEIEIKDGGATYKTETAGWWYEEYPTKRIKQPRVLNGMMYTLQGLIKYKTLISDTQADELLNQGLLALEQQLPNYDKKGDSYYDIHKTTTGGDYHQLHIAQLKLIHDYSKNSIFLDYARRWEKFDQQTFILRLIRKPSKINLSVYIIALFISGVIGLVYKILH